MKGDVLFPRIDLEAELKALEEIKKQAMAPEAPAIEHEPVIDYDEFMKSELRVVEILDCEAVKKSDKLLKFRAFDGERERTILSGIAQWYSPEELKGKKIAAVLNLAPRKIFGIESEGMLLSSDAEEGPKVVFIDESVPAGTRIR